MNAETAVTTLDDQRDEFASRRFIAMPLAGAIAWLIVGIAGLLLPSRVVALVLFAAVGAIFYLAMFISRFTGENLMAKGRRKNAFDSLLLHTVAMALLAFAIAIPFYLTDRTSLPLTVGILTGMMWLPFSWIIRHWVGLFHSITRTVLVVALWYLAPTHRFVSIPLAIVAIHVATIVILERRAPLRTVAA